ncbi:MAG: esterase [Prevotellaceae bacterium]|jgi:enterochelin esterase family protein|nr:esterase [Prevotellaceae bacterium]
MKKFSILSLALMCSASSFAQQALWGAGDVVSPKINSDNSVTFSIFAPEAQKIEVTGDFLPTKKVQTPMGEMDAPGATALAKNDKGVWEYTSTPLAPELYSYSFVIDGVKVTDPSSIYQIRDVASVTSVFIVEGERANLYKVNDVPHGSVARVWYSSPTLKIDRRMTIYTPPGYEKGEAKYPVLYLLHGAGGDEEAWIALGRTSQILDNLIAQGKAKPMVVVMTNGNAGQKAAPGESERGMYKPSLWEETKMNGDFEAAFPDVVSYVETNYRVEQEKQSRAICGLSMGGFHSLHISKQYPDLFDYVGLFSAAIMPPQQGVSSKVYDDFDEKLKVQFSKKPKLYWIAIGTADFLFQNNVDFRKKLDENGYKYEYYETGEGHIWKNWRIYLAEFAPKLFK